MSTNQLRNLFKTLDFIKEKTQNPELQVVSVQVLLEIAQRPETPMADIEAATGLSQAAVSRNVAKLGAGISIKEPGAGLVEAYEDPEYRRRKLVKLTPRGKSVITELNNLLSK
jgi:DNA-binding MarR family transcriptional regulator